MARSRGEPDMQTTTLEQARLAAIAAAEVAARAYVAAKNAGEDEDTLAELARQSEIAETRLAILTR